MQRKNIIRLTESELKKIISESVKRILRESVDDSNAGFTSSMISNKEFNMPSDEMAYTSDDAYARVKQIYDTRKNSFEAYQRLMDEFNMTQDELESSGIAQIFKEIDKQNEKWEAFNNSWY